MGTRNAPEGDSAVNWLAETSVPGGASMDNSSDCDGGQQKQAK